MRILTAEEPVRAGCSSRPGMKVITDGGLTYTKVATGQISTDGGKTWTRP